MRPGGHLGAGLGEPEDVVHEQQHVLTHFVAEVFGHGQRRKADAEPDAGWLVHLSEHQCRLVDDARLLHLPPQVVPLTGALADAGEHRNPAVLGGDAVDHFLDHDGLADSGAAEHADLAAAHVRFEQVDDLDTGFEHLALRRQVLEGRWRTVDRPTELGADGSVGGVQRLPQYIEDVAQGLGTDRNRDRGAGVANRGAAHQAVGRLHGDRPHPALPEMLGNLGNDRLHLAADGDLELDGVVDLG